MTVAIQVVAIGLLLTMSGRRIATQFSAEKGEM